MAAAERSHIYTERLPLGWAAGCTGCPWRFQPPRPDSGWPMPWAVAAAAALLHLLVARHG
jgi:hypothetical protein